MSWALTRCHIFCLAGFAEPSRHFGAAACSNLHKLQPPQSRPPLPRHNLIMSNKSRSQSGPTPVPDDTSGSNRRARRKEKAEREKNANAEAGPSRPSSRSQSRPSSIPPKSSETSKRTGKRAATDKENAFTGGEDFIPFASLDENDAPSTRKGSPPAREWDEGKPKDKGKERERAREGEGGGAGRKRKAEEIDFNDGYANKKERVAAASRKAPWVRDMDWEHCANVAELYVESSLAARHS